MTKVRNGRCHELASVLFDFQLSLGNSFEDFLQNLQVLGFGLGMDQNVIDVHCDMWKTLQQLLHSFLKYPRGRGNTARQACVAEEAFAGINDYTFDSSSLSCGYAWLRSNCVKTSPHLRVMNTFFVLGMG